MFLQLTCVRIPCVLSLPVYLCLWNLRGGGESTTLRDYDLICILWSCVLVVTVDNWSMPLIPALCLSTGETPFHEIFVNSQTEVRGPFRSFEVDMMIPLKLSFLRSWILSLAEEILKIWVHMLSGMHKHPKKWAHTQTWQRQMYKDKKKTTFTSFNSIVCYLMIQHYQQKHIPFCPVVLEFPPALYQIILLLMESNKLIDWLEYLSIHIHKFTASASRGIPRCTCPLTYDF